ncbi:MAG: hypothetical protein O3C17_18855 [Planctomycetota bacterium]|jgi:hypothetical protein|nr:hypothetical protein [Planctomycetota bacterium]
MHQNFAWVAVALVTLNLFSGCAAFEGETRLPLPDVEPASSDENDSKQRVSRRPKAQVETSLSHGDGLTFGTARVSVAAMLPVDPPDRMLLIEPFFAAHTLDSDLDAPSRLFSTGINAMWLERVNDQVALTFAVNPSVSGDDAEFGRTVRVFAMGAVAWDWIPDELRLTTGAAWLGRSDIGVVPAAGLEWTPNDDWNVSLILPRPRVSRRLTNTETSETWLYAAGSINGGTFDVRRADGKADELSLTEFQTAVGVDVTNEQFGRAFCEIGAGFGRKLQYERGAEEVTFDPGVVLRMGVTR